MIPRYITRVGELSDMPVYIFPMQSVQRTKPVATLVVETNLGITVALEKALEWGEAFGERWHGFPLFPKVRATRKNAQWLLTKARNGSAWIEKPNGGRGMWLPIEMLST
jgi:hypothetical protein